MEGLAAGQAMQQDGMEGLAAGMEAALRRVLRDLQQEDILDRASFPQPQQEAVEVVSPDLLDHAEYATMLYNRKVLKALEWCTQERLAMLDDAAVLEIARAASEWSCMNHPGVFASRVARVGSTRPRAAPAQCTSRLGAFEGRVDGCCTC